MPNPLTHYQNLTYISNNPYWCTANIWKEFMHRYNKEFLNHKLYLFVAFTGSFPANKMLEEFPHIQLENCINRFKNGTVKREVVVLLDGHTEGVGWVHIRDIVENLINKHDIHPKNIIHWTGSYIENIPIQTVQNLSALSLVTDHTSVNVTNLSTHHFVMLARVPRLHRILAAVEVLKRNLLTYGYASCGSGNYGELDMKVFDVVPDNLRHLFPLSIDGIHVGTTKSRNSGLLFEVSGAFCQLIPESCHDVLLQGWIDPFPTEKTTKCFLLKQVPIWITPPKFVKNIRDLGFDVFDDLIDHSYDLELDPYKRISMAVGQLEKICTQTLEELNNWKTTNQHRFEHNRNLCIEFKNNFIDTHYEKFKECMNVVSNK